jgi:hypothetical protein
LRFSVIQLKYVSSQEIIKETCFGCRSQGVRIGPGQWVQMALSSWVKHPQYDVDYLPLSNAKVKAA